MKTRRSFLVPMAAILWSLGFSLGWAQFTVPPNPNDASRRKIGENGGVSGGAAAVNVAPGAAPATTIVIQYVAVTAMRQWTNAEGKTMVARLLAYAAPKEGEPGPVEVIRDGNVRFLLERGKQPIDYPLTGLSQADQINIKAIAQAARAGAPGQAAEAAKGEEPKKPETPADPKR